MEISDRKLGIIAKRIMMSRMRILINHGFYGLLLMHMKISISEKHETAWTDCGKRIWFNPVFVENISDNELDYAMMHEIMHVALRHTSRLGDYEREMFNEAADIVVNSNIYHSNNDNEDSISIGMFGGPMAHTTPNGREGYEYSVEEVYQMLLTIRKSGGDNGDERKGGTGDISEYGGWDYHEDINEYSLEDSGDRLSWQGYIRQACEALSVRDGRKGRGLLPALAKRYMLELSRSQVDWRQLLVEFVQDEVNDYSFMPPDRRMDDCPFFLPDFNERDYIPGKVLFAVDTSGSMSDQEITVCYSEIAGAINQFAGKLEGLLCFFDARLTGPVSFHNVDDLLSIKPIGGGGTSYDVIFDYIDKLDEEDRPRSIVILTDGYAPFPELYRSRGIPVLWIINNEEIEVPWGKVARINI